MKPNRILLLILFAAVSSVPSSGLSETTFERIYGGAEPDCGYSVQQTLDGGYVIAGETRSFGAGLGDVFLIRTDSLGDTLWTATYGGASGDYGYSVLQTSDGGFAIAGGTISAGSMRPDVYLVRTDASGDTVWTRTYGDTLEDKGFSVGHTSDGGYILAGHFCPDFWPDMYLVKTDSSGTALWTETYGGVDSDWGRSCQETSDGGYIAVGWSTSFPALLYDVYMVKTDSSGNMLWSKLYGGGG